MTVKDESMSDTEIRVGDVVKHRTSGGRGIVVEVGRFGEADDVEKAKLSLGFDREVVVPLTALRRVDDEEEGPLRLEPYL